jgi:hypothetical protein
MSVVEMESVRTKLLIAQVFSIISLVAWLVGFLYYMYALYAFELANEILTGLGLGGMGDVVASTMMTCGVLFLVLVCASAVVVKRIYDMYNAANSGNIDRLKQLNSMMWSILAIIFSGIVPGIMLLLSQGPIENLAGRSVTESVKLNAVDNLMKLKSQLDAGTITEQEFKAFKEQLLCSQPKDKSIDQRNNELMSEHHPNLGTPPNAVHEKFMTSASATVESLPIRQSAHVEDKSVPREDNLETILNQPTDSAEEIPWEHYERLWKLKTLLESKVITNDEFEIQKNKLLQRKSENTSTESKIPACPACGKPLPADLKVKFCPYCRTKMTSSSTPVVVSSTS